MRHLLFATVALLRVLPALAQPTAPLYDAAGRVPGAGSASIAEWQAGGTWTTAAQPVATGGAGLDFVGGSASLSGERALVGVSSPMRPAGAVVVVNAPTIAPDATVMQASNLVAGGAPMVYAGPVPAAGAFVEMGGGRRGSVSLAGVNLAAGVTLVASFRTSVANRTEHRFLLSLSTTRTPDPDGGTSAVVLRTVNGGLTSFVSTATPPIQIEGRLPGPRPEQPLVVAVRIPPVGSVEVWQGLSRVHVFDTVADLALADFLVIGPDQPVKEHGPLRLWNRVLSDDELAQAVLEVEAQIAVQETAAGLPSPLLPGLVLTVFGDSISDYSLGYADVWTTRIPDWVGLTGVSHARGGATLRVETGVGVPVSAQIAGAKLITGGVTHPRRPRTLALIWAGTNDLYINRSASNDPAVAGEALRLCVLEARAKGYEKVAVVTMLPRALETVVPMTQAEYGAWRNTYNAFVRTGTGADYVWDAGALEAMQNTSFPTYHDGLHTLRLGSQILADDFARWLDSTGLLATRTVPAGEPLPALPALDAAPFALSAPRPNPASGHALMTLTLDRPQRVRAVLVDALGRTVAVLHDGEAEGVVPLAVDAGALAPGVYVVRVAGSEVTAARRITVAR